MTKFSANLGFLWQELSLPDAIRAARKAGFDAVESHWPYDTPPEEAREAIADTAFTQPGLNTIRGDVAGSENGHSALPGRAQLNNMFGRVRYILYTWARLWTTCSLRPASEQLSQRGLP